MVQNTLIDLYRSMSNYRKPRKSADERFGALQNCECLDSLLIVMHCYNYGCDGTQCLGIIWNQTMDHIPFVQLTANDPRGKQLSTRLKQIRRIFKATKLNHELSI